MTDKKPKSKPGPEEQKVPPKDLSVMLAGAAAKIVVPDEPHALVPVYAAVPNVRFLYGGETYHVPHHGIGHVPRPVCPPEGTRSGVRALYGEDSTACDADGQPLSSERRVALNRALIEQADIESTLDEVPEE